MVAVESPVWMRSKNLSADLTGSIHDDAQARSLGFKGALIGGSVHSAFVTKAVVERFGQAWYERGFMKQAYIRPLYESDEFRIVLEPLTPGDGDEVLCELAFETRDGMRTTAGYAGLAKSAESALPPWEREPAAEADTADGAAATFSRTVTISESASRRSLVGDTSEWYTSASPWGGAIVPSFMYMLLGAERQVRTTTETVPSAAMNSVWELLQTAPMFAETPYEVTARVVQSGASERSGSRTTEYAITGADGRTVAVARQKIRWLLKQ